MNTIDRHRIESAALLLGTDPDRLRRALTATATPVGAPALMSAKEAARQLSISPRLVHQWMTNGRLPKITLSPPHPRRDGRMVGGRVAVLASDVAALIMDGMARHTEEDLACKERK